MGDLAKQGEREKEQYRARVAELEQRVKDAERTRSQGMFEHEKERARWQLDKDALGCKMQELEEQVEKLLLQKETLMKENTRMKVENKQSKSSVRASTILHHPLHAQTPS